MRFTLLFLLVSARAMGSDLWTYWIDPCGSSQAAESQCKPTDPELARWAIEAWARSSNDALTVKPESKQDAARLRVHWVSGRSQLYGEARPIPFGNKRGAEVYVLPATARSGEDPLDRETVVYLTCLHETGHAFGLRHTDRFVDIMYSFQFGGDIPEYFARYRRQLKVRSDIAHTSAISPADRAALMASIEYK